MMIVQVSSLMKCELAASSMREFKRAHDLLPSLVVSSHRNYGDCAGAALFISTMSTPGGATISADQLKARYIGTGM